MLLWIFEEIWHRFEKNLVNLFIFSNIIKQNIYAVKKLFYHIFIS